MKGRNEPPEFPDDRLTRIRAIRLEPRLLPRRHQDLIHFGREAQSVRIVQAGVNALFEGEGRKVHIQNLKQVKIIQIQILLPIVCCSSLLLSFVASPQISPDTHTHLSPGRSFLFW